MEAAHRHGEPRRPSHEARVPSLDCLPPEILDTVVSRLHVCDAVRTSAISRAWRRRWESAPGIRFDWRHRSAPLAAICAVLARYACPVRDFRYSNIGKEAFAHTDQVLALLAGRGVQHLFLRFRPCFAMNRYTLHPAVFSCHELTHLSLYCCHLPAAPSGFAGFPNLTSLSLSQVGLLEHAERGLEAMVLMSPLLEMLELKGLWTLFAGFEEWTIRAPNLQILSIVAGDDFGWQVEALPSLQQASVITLEYSLDRDFVKLLTHLAQVRELEFCMPLTGVNSLDGFSCYFQKLKILKLHTDFCDVSSISSTFSLLTSAPNLEILQIEIVDNRIHDEEVDMDFFNALWTNSLFANLKHVIMKNVSFWSNEMHLIEFIMSKAKQLCSFYVYQIIKVTLLHTQ